MTFGQSVRKFLDASSHLYKRVCPCVGLSVHYAFSVTTEIELSISWEIEYHYHDIAYATAITPHTRARTHKRRGRIVGLSASLIRWTMDAAAIYIRTRLLYARRN